MGFMEKMKNLFTEEEEIVEPVKKEVMQVEIKAPTVQREKLEEQHIEVEPVTPAPVFFDDKDFATLEQPKPKPRPVPVEKKVERPAYKTIKDRKEKHQFKPSPIISPVYGILDKNYKKEDIVDKSDTPIITSSRRTAKEMTLDEVRQKAFGTLEDDIDLNLNTERPKRREELMESVYDETTLENDIFEEMRLADRSIETETDDITLGNVHSDSMIDIIRDNGDDLEETLNNVELDESDLFNLIDSMYEKRDEE